MNIIKAGRRGRTDIGWLKSFHSFSFGEYHDESRMGYRSLRVLNDDTVAPGQGFGTHGHRDMEIISVVLEGELEHKDSMGHGEVLRPGEVQVMSAGRGVRHSEFNPSKANPVHFIQIWIMPEKEGLPPAYGQKAFPLATRKDRLARVAGRDGVEKDGAIRINQDADVYLAGLSASASVTHTPKAGHGVYVHIATGKATVGGKALEAGDAAEIEGSAAVTITGGAGGCEAIVFDLGE